MVARDVYDDLLSRVLLLLPLFFSLADEIAQSGLYFVNLALFFKHSKDAEAVMGRVRRLKDPLNLMNTLYVFTSRALPFPQLLAHIEERFAAEPALWQQFNSHTLSTLVFCYGAQSGKSADFLQGAIKRAVELKQMAESDHFNMQTGLSIAGLTLPAEVQCASE